MALQVNINWQQLEKVPVKTKAAVLVAVLALIGGLFYYFLYLPKSQELDQLNQQLAELQREYNATKAIADNLPTFEEEVRRLNERFAVALTKLPNSAEIDKILIDLPNLAKEEELGVKSFKPAPNRGKGFYAVVPLNLKMTGPYNRLAKFFEKIGRLNRIIAVRDVKFRVLSGKGVREGEVTLDADVQAETYTFVENPGADPKNKKKGGR